MQPDPKEIAAFFAAELEEARIASIPPAGAVAFVTDDSGPFYRTAEGWADAFGEVYGECGGMVCAFNRPPESEDFHYNPLARWVGGMEFLTHGQLICRGYHSNLAAAELAISRLYDHNEGYPI